MFRQKIHFFAGALLLSQISFAQEAKDSAGQVVSLSLKDAVVLGIANSPNVKSAEQDYKAALQRAGVTKSVFFPQVSLQLETGTYRDRTPLPGDTSVPLVAQDYNRYSGRVVLQENLFSGFGDISNMAKSNTDVQEYWQKLEQAKFAVFQNAAETYLSIQLERRNLDAENEILDLRKKQLEDVVNRFSAGRSTELEKLQSEYALKSTIPEIQRMKANIEQKTLELVRLLGIDLGAKVTLKDSLDDTFQTLDKSTKLPTLAEAYQRTLSNNPELQALRLEYEKSGFDYSVTRAKHLPKLDLILTAGTDAYYREEIGDPDSQAISGMIRLTVPLFSGLSSLGELGEIRELQVKVTYQQTVKREELFSKLTDLYNQINLAKAQLVAEQLNLNLASETINKAKSFYSMGRATLTELLDAYSYKLNAIKQLAQAQYDTVKAVIDLNVLMGLSPDSQAEKPGNAGGAKGEKHS